MTPPTLSREDAPSKYGPARTYSTHAACLQCGVWFKKDKTHRGRNRMCSSRCATRFAIASLGKPAKYPVIDADGKAARLPLSRGQEAVIDPCDVMLVSQFTWHASKNDSGRWYAATNLRADGKRKQMPLHRLLTGAGPGMVVDHIDGDGLNNRRSNMRVCTVAENQWNSRKQRVKATSQFKGVYRAGGSWVAVIRANGARHHLGSFADEKKAAAAYDAAAMGLHGEFAMLNRPYDPALLAAGEKEESRG